MKKEITEDIPKEIEILFGAESSKKFIVTLDEEFINQLKEYIELKTNKTKLPSCGQRYERENNEEEEN